jgi:hypothetical protein
MRLKNYNFYNIRFDLLDLFLALLNLSSGIMNLFVTLQNGIYPLNETFPFILVSIFNFAIVFLFYKISYKKRKTFDIMVMNALES